MESPLRGERDRDGDCLIDPNTGDPIRDPDDLVPTIIIRKIEP